MSDEPTKTAPSVSKKLIDLLLADSEFTVQTVHDKVTVVTCKLPNGFVIVESSGAVSPENYDAKIGEEICRKRIEDKLWMLEGYSLQKTVYAL